jgi:hypothetical protein
MPLAPARPARISPALRIAAWIWLSLLTVGSLQPARPGPVKLLHRPVHYVAFGGAALLLLPLSRTRRREILGALAIFLLGFSLEIIQYLINRNYLEWRDVGDDGLAILLAFVLYRLTGSWKPK